MSHTTYQVYLVTNAVTGAQYVGVFDSVVAASEATGVRRTSLQRALTNPRHRPGGYRVQTASNASA